MAINGIPVVWKPSPDHNVGRFGLQPIAIVHHRAVANSLNSIDATLISSSRMVSAHFGIGYYKDSAGVNHLEIHQYVDLSDTAWCNGDLSETGNWATWYGVHRTPNGFYDVNPKTISIEHEDNGGSTDPAVKGIVAEAIIKASISLDKLMLSGDLAAIRAAGIHIREAGTAAALKAIPLDTKHLIDHRDIAGGAKPYCWRPWSADKTGFPRARYILETARVVAAPVTYTKAELDAAVAAALAAKDATFQTMLQAAILKARQEQYDLDKVAAESDPVNIGTRPA